MVMRKIKITLEYRGTHFRGWQRQREGQTVQGELERALTTLTREKIEVSGAGRTDAGVHAYDQVASFDTTSDLDVARIRRSLNALLSPDIVVKNVVDIDQKFDPRRDALWREYHYYILNRDYPTVFFKDLVLHESRILDVSAMSQAVAHLIGRHDFAAFCTESPGVLTTVRTMLEADVSTAPNIVWGGESLEGLVTVRLRAHAFLYNMVRIIVGTLLEVGIGRIPPERVKEILLSKDRNQSGRTLPPHGLTLVRVAY